MRVKRRREEERRRIGKEWKERKTRVKPEGANCLKHKLLTLFVGCLDLCNLLVGTRAQNFNETLFICPHPLHCFTQ